MQLEQVERDVMLLEAKKVRLKNMKERRNDELEEVTKLQEGIKKEKQDAKDKRAREMAGAQKIIAMNEHEKQKRDGEARKEKERAVKMMEDLERLAVEQDRKRGAEKAKREARITAIMSRMGDVAKKSDEAEKAFDLQILKDALQKDKVANDEDARKKKAAYDRAAELRRVLLVQTEEVRRRKSKVKEENAKFVRMVLRQDDEYNNRQAEIKDETFQKNVELKKAQKQQIERKKVTGIGAEAIPGIEGRLRAIHMSPNEIWMNKEILENIASRKTGRNQ